MSPSDAAVIRLQPGQLLRCPPGRDAWLSVVRGRVWLTRAGDPDDHFLDSGQSAHLRAGAQALVSAEASAHVILALGPTRLQRLMARLRGTRTGWRPAQA